MSTLPASRVFALAARDLVVAIAAGESFADYLDDFAKRRAPLYARADATVPDDQYWPGVARALAPLCPPETMPMGGLIEAGITLEGGARGLRSLFTKNPSDKDRKRVQRYATLAARVMEAVAGADDELSEDELRGISMAMASFGLDDDELVAARAPAKLRPEQIEVFGEIDAKLLRELLRGAWSVALRGGTNPRSDEAVRTLAARLDISDQCEAVRSNVADSLARVGNTAALSVELARSAGAALAPDLFASALEGLIRSAAPPSHAKALRERVSAKEPPRFEGFGLPTRPRRLQAVALAWATLTGTDPSYSLGLHLRGELSTAAGEAGAAYEVTEALDAVDRYLHQRLRDASAPAPAAEPAPTPAGPTEPTG